MALALAAEGAAQRTSSGPKLKLREGTVLVQRAELPYRNKTLMSFRGTALYRLRQGQFATTWRRPTKTIHYADGHSLRITMVTNPSVANGENSIRRNVKVLETSKSPDVPGWECSTQQIQLSATSSSFLNNDYGNANSHIYPGAIFSFDDFYAGQYRETRGERNPMTMVTDNPNINGSSSVVVPSPDVASCRDAIATLYRRFTKDTATESTAFDVVESNNTADLTMQISGGASAFGASFSAAFGAEKSSRSYSLTVDARKSLYSISVMPPQNGFFKDASVERTPNLMVVSNVVYGVRVLANLNITFNSAKDALDFKAAYSGMGYSAQAAVDYVQKHSSTVISIHAYIVGGSGGTEVSLDKSALMRSISGVMGTATYQNARPISYQFMNMAGDLVGSTSATDTFRVVQCAPSDAAATLTSARVRFVQGNDGKNAETGVELDVSKRDGGPALLQYFVSKNAGKYPDNGTVDVTLRAKGDGVDANTFLTSGGGKIDLYVFRYGHKDTWKIARLVLVLNYSDGSSHTVEFDNVQTKEGDPPLHFFFDGEFRPVL